MKKVIALLFGVLLLSAATATAQLREIYTIRDIEVEESASSVIQAQQAAFTSARIKGAYRLVERLTLPEDRAGKFTSASIDAGTANKLAVAVDVEEEERGGGKYVGKLAVVYNPNMVRDFLDRRGIPYLDQTAPKSVIFPVSGSSGSYAWNSAWPDRSNGQLAPFETSRGASATPGSGWDAMQGAVSAADARRAIKAELLGSAGSFRVRLTSVTGAGETELGTTGSASTLEEAAQQAADYLDLVWKKQAIVRSDERTDVEATVLFTSLPEWNSLRSALSRSPLVSGFEVEGLSRQGAVVKFAYAGDTPRLVSNLRERGITVDTDDMGWVMTSAVTRAPG